MGDILKEAIADAKAVRETALENAKMALEEAFTPQIKSMLSAKLKEDELEESDPVVEEDEEDEEVPAEEAEDHGEEHGDDEEAAEETYEDEEAGDEEGEEVPAEEADEFEDEEEVEEENLDLEAIIKELESELTEEEDEDGEEVEESTETSEESVSEGEGDDEEDEPVEESKDETVEEEYEIDENALKEEDEEDEEVEESNTSALESELKEYKEAVHFLKGKLHEVNILNAKLLFTNKLFKQYSLDNNQKLKVVETFDRAQTTREIKLVYSTLAEQFNDNSTIVTRKSIKESASAPVASTKPSKESKKVISEETQVANRFKKLAGLIK